MPIYSEAASELAEEFQSALQAQSAALKELTAALAAGKYHAAATAPEMIEAHNNRVMDLYARLQPFRLD